MRRIWSLGILLTLTGCVSAGQGYTRQGAPGYGAYAYNDVLRPHGRARGEAAEQAAISVCGGGSPERIGTAKFDACMRGRGWRVANGRPAPQGYSPSYEVSSPSYDTTPSSPAPDYSSQSATDASSAAASSVAAQQQNDAANAATVQTEYQFNTIYNAPN
jgi:hypothetical protein